MSVKQDKRRLLGPANAISITQANSHISNLETINKEGQEDGTNEICLEHNILKTTANSSILYNSENNNKFLSILSALYLKPYKSSFVESGVVNVNFEDFSSTNEMSTYEHFLQQFLETSILLSEYPKTGLDFFVKNVTISNIKEESIGKKIYEELELLEQITNSIISLLLEANISLKYWPSVGVSQNKKTICIFVKNETEVLNFFSKLDILESKSIEKDIEECRKNAASSRLLIRKLF
ncbi:hypothetical protein FOG48_01122 [Hanseniaspora uvarum]|mgnify:CR=1 FL=1|nr:hypothetical protein FOG48_01122 [Hanseniaspora uvarum]GMM42134.1 exosome non-catalytic core subunit [Hanseniaspora uvarum]